MALTPTSYWDEDEERRRRDELYSDYVNPPALPSAHELAPAPTATASIAPPTEAPPPPAAFSQSRMDEATAAGDALERRRDDAMSAYLSQAATPPPERSAGSKVGEFFGDNAVGLLGTLLDAGFNKGRNIPAILSQNAVAQDASRKARAADEDRLMDFQLRAQNQRAQLAKGREAAERDQEYKRALAQHWAAQEAASKEGLGLRERGIQLRELKSKLDNDPNHPAVVELKRALYANGVPEGSLDGATLVTLRANPAYRQAVDLFYKKQGIPVEAQRAAATSRAAAQGSIDVQTDPGNVEALAAAARERAEATALGSQVGQAAGKQEAGTTLALEDLEPELNRLGIEVANRPLTTSALKGVHAPKLIVQARAYARARKAIEMADHEKTRFTEAAMRGDLVEARNAARTYNNHKDEYAGAMMDLTDVKTQAAQEEFKHQVPSIMDPTLSLDTIYKQIEAGAESGLGVYGMRAKPPDIAAPLLGRGGGGHAPAPAHPTPAPAARPKPQASPAAPASPPSTAGMVRMRNPATGNTGWVKPERVKEKVDAGYEVIQ